MTLLARNLTTSPITLSFGGNPTLPSSTVAGTRGIPVDVTNDLIPNLTVDPANGKIGGLDNTNMTGLSNMVSSGEVSFEWDGVKNYKTGPLAVMSPFQLSKFVVGQEPNDEHSVSEMVNYASSMASPTNPSIVYIKPGTYTETSPVQIDGSVQLVALRTFNERYEFYKDSVQINGRVVITGDVDDVSRISGVRIIPTTSDPVVYVNTLGKTILSDVYVGEITSSINLVTVLSGSLKLVSSTVDSKNPRKSIIATGGSVSCYNSLIGGQGISPGLTSENSDFTFISNSPAYSIYGKCVFTGTGKVYMRGAHHITGHSVSVSATRSPVVFENCRVEQNTTSTTKTIMVDGSCKIVGRLWEGTPSGLVMDIRNIYPPDNSTTLSTQVDILNCDCKAVIKSTAGNLTLNQQEKTCIVNKTVDEVTSITLPIAPLLGEEHLIIDGKGDANIRNITVLGGAKLINGLPSVLISTSRGSMKVLYDGTGWNRVM